MSRIDPPAAGSAEPSESETREFVSTREHCRAALNAPDLRQILDVLGHPAETEHRVLQAVGRVDEAPASWRTIIEMARSIARAGRVVEPAAFERFVLLTAALAALDRLPALPVDRRVKSLFCDEFGFFAAPAGEHAARYAIGSASFVAMCKVATLRRFPAGQFDWELGGIRRSDLLKSHPTRLLATLAFVTWRMKGLAPVFFSHLNWRRSNRSLLEIEANRSYFRMAQSLRLQPHVRGFAACSWFRSPATHRVSPHLAWLSDVFLNNGGYVVEAGPDSAESGVLHRSRTRRELFEAGRFRPTKGLVMWPREAMIAWAERHPEYGD